jgi:hypothetical protein
MSKIQFIGIKEQSKALRIVNNKLFRGELDRLPNGRYRITVEKYRKAKSNPQLGYYYACVLPLSQKLLIDAGWEFASLEEVDIFWKSQFANRELINRHTGEIMDVPGLKRNMTTTDFMAFTDAVRNYCSEFLGGVIPDPEVNIEIQFKDEK